MADALVLVKRPSSKQQQLLARSPEILEKLMSLRSDKVQVKLVVNENTPEWAIDTVFNLSDKEI